MKGLIEALKLTRSIYIGIILIVGGTRFDSANLYASLDRGVTYDMKTSGFRVGFFDSFPNIIESHRLPAD